MIKAIVFDFDGLILDTETNEYHTWREIYLEHGADLPLDIWAKHVGTIGTFDPCGYLEECTGRKIDRDQIIQERRARYYKKMELEKVRPGVESYIQEAKRLGLHIGVASSSNRSWVEGNLKKLGLIQHFDVIRTSNDVEEVKPNPKLYQLVLEHFGIEPKEAIAFEDSPNGSLAAKRAGMYCVTVPNSITEGLSFGEIDLRLDSMAEMSLIEVMKKIDQQSFLQGSV